MFSVWYEISFAEVILHWGLSLKLPHVASYVSVCVPNLCLLILFLGLVTSLPSWFRPSLRSSFVWGMIHVESTEFSTQLMHVFSKEMQLDKADEMEEVTHVFHAAIAFFFRMCSGAAGDVRFLFLQCSVLLRHHFHHIFTTHVLRMDSWNRWLVASLSKKM